LNFYFRLFPGSIKAPQVSSFWKHLQCTVHSGGRYYHLGRPARSSSQPVGAGDFVSPAASELNSQLEFLPAYARKLNPVGIHLGIFLSTTTPSSFFTLELSYPPLYSTCI